MKEDCPVCGKDNALEERTDIHNVWGIEVESIYSFCRRCRTAITTTEQSKTNVERCKAAGCYESPMYKEYWEGYSSG